MLLIPGDDSDYVAVSEMLTFDLNELTKNVTITINADLKIEDVENFTVVVSPINDVNHPFPVRVNPNEGVTTVTIEDEDCKSFKFNFPIKLFLWKFSLARISHYQEPMPTVHVDFLFGF